MARESDVHGVVGSRLTIGPGATLAVFVDMVPGQLLVSVKYLSGGTLEILGASLGSTLPAADLVSLSGTGYLMGATETRDLSGPARFYLSALGATTMVTLLREKSHGN